MTIATVPYITNDDLFGTASAINYWVSDLRYHYVDPTVDVLDLEITGVYLRVFDESEDPRYHGKRFTVTPADLNAAAKRVLDEKLAAPYILEYIDGRDIDAEALDVAFQVACFGEVVYG